MSKIKESSRELNELFASLANQVAQDLPQGWTDMTFAMIRTLKEGEEFLVYASCDGGKSWEDMQLKAFEEELDQDGVLDAMDTAQEIYEVCADEEDCWGSMTFRLKSDGQFKVNFGYEVYRHVTEEIRKKWRDAELHP